MVRTGFELAERILSFPSPVVIACTRPRDRDGRLPRARRRLPRRRARAVPDRRERGRDRHHRCRASASRCCRQRLAPAHFHRAVVTRRDVRARGRGRGGFLDRVVPAAELGDAARDVAASSGSSTSTCTPRASCARAGTRCAAIRAAIEADDAAFRRSSAARGGGGLTACRGRSSGRPSCATACCASRSRCCASEGVAALTTRRVAEQAAAPRRPPSTSCSATRPGSSARSSSRDSACCGGASTRSPRRADPRADLVARAPGVPRVHAREPGAGRADVLAPLHRLRSGPSGLRGRRRACASSSWAACGAASTRACSPATRPTSRTRSSRSRRASPRPRSRAGSARRRRR